MKCVVVGGGVIGASIAWHLAKQGVAEVVLVERDRLGSGTTWHSAGNITWKPSRDHDAPMFFADSAETRRNLEGFDRAARESAIGARWIEPGEAARLNPLLDPSAVEAV